ncbi:MAG: extracellular solute-binding protein [Chloroflexota bacterium]
MAILKTSVGFPDPRVTRRGFHRWLAAGGGVALAACAAPGSEGEVGRTARPAVTLEYWSRFGPPIQDVEEQRLPVFMEQFAPIKVERTTITGGAAQLAPKLTTAFASNTAPDVFTIGSRALVIYADPGWALALDAYPAVRKAAQDFFGPPQQVATYQGKLYGLTYLVDARLTMWRKDLLAGEGLPTARQQLPNTWDEFRKTAKQLARYDGGQLVRAGFDIPKRGSNVFNLFMLIVAQQGKGFLNPQGTEVAFSGPEGERALQMMVDFVHRDRLDAFERPDPPRGVPLLATPITAGQWTNSQSIRRVGEAQVDPAATLAPAFTPEFDTKPTAAAYLGGTWQLVNKAAKDVDAAIELLLFLAGRDHLLAVAEATTSVPPLKSAGQADYLKNPLLRIFYDSLPYGWSVPQHPRFTEMFERIRDNNTDAMAQKKSAKAALTDSAAYCNALLAGG